MVSVRIVHQIALNYLVVPWFVNRRNRNQHSSFLQPVFAALSAYLVLSPAAKRGNLRHRQHLPSTFHLASDRAVDIEERPFSLGISDRRKKQISEKKTLVKHKN